MRALLLRSGAAQKAPVGENSTIGVVVTNARLTKAQATKIAQMAHDGLARTISPIHTMYDGDTMFALATGTLAADADVDARSARWRPMRWPRPCCAACARRRACPGCPPRAICQPPPR